MGRLIMGWALLWCVILAMLAVVVWPDDGSGVTERLQMLRSSSRSFSQRANDEYGVRNGWALPTATRAAEALPRSGIAHVLAAVIARLKSGGTMVEAFEEQIDGCFAVRKLTMQRLADLFTRRCLPDESHVQVMRAAVGVSAAAAVSEELGCRAVPCLEAVLGVYRQMRLMQNLKAQAFAVPKATIGLLSSLPLVAVALGELMGARPLMFLFGSQQGLACLASGGCCYAVGLIWVRCLLRDS